MRVRVATEADVPALASLRRAYVEEERGRVDDGVGTALVAAVLAYADERGYVRVVLSPSDRAIPLYQRAGFVEADGTKGDHLLVRPGPKP